MPKKIKRPVGPINPPPNQSGLGGPKPNPKPKMKGNKVASSRKGTQLIKALNKNQAPVKAVGRKRAKKAFTGSAKNFKKAYKAYSRTIKKRRSATVRKDT